MYCSKCDRELEWCICEDADSRIESLRKTLLIDVDAIMANRFLNKFAIERQREEHKKSLSDE